MYLLPSWSHYWKRQTSILIRIVSFFTHPFSRKVANVYNPPKSKVRPSKCNLPLISILFTKFYKIKFPSWHLLVPNFLKHKFVLSESTQFINILLLIEMRFFSRYKYIASFQWLSPPPPPPPPSLIPIMPSTDITTPFITPRKDIRTSRIILLLS